MININQLKKTWNKLFGGNRMQVRATKNEEEFGRCGCGRSPTGKCIGWHGLTESQYKVKLEEYKREQQGKQ